ncbi:hypothetical protein F4782DRAFT_480215 [Xylaria castorea]|nr:hypothetical protein F4782DRAFT_480215 [Xylaria castorea]
MHSTKVLLSIAALAGTSLSQKSDSEFCSSLIDTFFSEIMSEAPTTPAAILSFIAASTTVSPAPTGVPAGAGGLDPEAHQSQLCSLATALPSSLLPEFQTLASGLLAFGKNHSSEFIAYVTDCAPADEIASSTSYFNYIFTATGNICKETPTPAPGGASNGTYGTYPTATPTATSHFNTSSSMIPTAAAARPTGAFLGAAAVGGVLGAAAML